MTFKVQILCSLVIFLVIQGCVDQTSAACPTVAPMANFNPQNFLGTWYAIKRYQTLVNALATSCTAMNLTLTNRNVFNLEICNLFKQRAPFKILGILLSSGIINYKFQIGASKIINRVSSSFDSNIIPLKS